MRRAKPTIKIVLRSLVGITYGSHAGLPASLVADASPVGFRGTAFGFSIDPVSRAELAALGSPYWRPMSGPAGATARRFSRLLGTELPC